MTRREFIWSSSAAVSVVALGARAATVPPARDDFISAMIRTNDAAIPALLARQERRAGHRWCGGVPDGYGIFAGRETAHFIALLASAASVPESAYFQSAQLVEPLQLAARCLLAFQHPDGTTDQPTTNFHSTPDTGFTIESVTQALTILRAGHWAALDGVAADLGTFAQHAGEALATGGVHTPNHRWVVSAALARINALFPHPKYVARIDQWFAEGIDIDPDGQFTEKSTAIYSPVVDHMLLTVARLLDRPALLEPVRRNLEMTLYYVHPDGEVVTEASKRQDKYQRGSMGYYYIPYRALALRDRDGRFAAMARQIERTAGAASLASDLPAFLDEVALQAPLPPDAPLPTDYEKLFAYSALARIRRGDVSATILAENSTLFALRKGAAALEAVRLASAFFGKGQFVGDKLEAAKGRYVMRQALEGPYFQPITKEQLDADGGHVKLAPNGTLAAGTRALRAQSNIQHLDGTVTVTEKSGRFELAIELTGTDDVPVAVELAFRRGGELSGVEPVADTKDAFLLRGERGRYTCEGRTIEFGPGRVEHTWTQLRGALPKWDGLSVYLTGFTPFRATLQIS